MKESPSEHWRRITTCHGRPHDRRMLHDHLDEFDLDTSDRRHLKRVGGYLLLIALVGLVVWLSQR